MACTVLLCVCDSFPSTSQDMSTVQCKVHEVAKESIWKKANFQLKLNEYLYAHSGELPMSHGRLLNGASVTIHENEEELLKLVLVERI